MIDIGGDDMRQDAVMEQVFQHVNHTLKKDDATRRRGLHMRTYKVIPTSPQTGIWYLCMLFLVLIIIIIYFW